PSSAVRLISLPSRRSADMTGARSHSPSAFRQGCHWRCVLFVPDEQISSWQAAPAPMRRMLYEAASSRLPLSSRATAPRECARQRRAADHCDPGLLRSKEQALLPALSLIVTRGGT